MIDRVKAFFHLCANIERAKPYPLNIVLHNELVVHLKRYHHRVALYLYIYIYIYNIYRVLPSGYHVFVCRQVILDKMIFN